MVALYIVLGVVLLVLLLLFCNISAQIFIDDDITIKIGYLLYRKKLPLNKPKKEKSKSDANAKKEPSAIKKMVKEQGLRNTIVQLIDVVKVLLQKLGGLAKHIRVKRFDLSVTVADKDPATTGIEYGALCAVVYPFIGILKNTLIFNEKKANVLLNADFENGKPKFKFYAKLKVRFLFVLIAAIGALMVLVKSNLIKIKNNKTTINKK